MPHLPLSLKRTAESRWAAFQQAVQDKNLTWPQAAEATEALKTAFAFSAFVSRTAIRRPDIAINLMAGGDITRSYSKSDLSSRFQQRLSSPLVSAHSEEDGGHGEAEP